MSDASFAFDGEQSVRDFADSVINESWQIHAGHCLLNACVSYLYFFYQDNPQDQTVGNVVKLLRLTRGDSARQKLTPLDLIILGYEDSEDKSLTFKGYKQWLIEKYGSEAAAKKSYGWFVIDQYEEFKRLIDDHDFSDFSIAELVIEDLNSYLAEHTQLFSNVAAGGDAA